MLTTVLSPLVLLIWFAGAAIVDEIVNFFKQIPDMFGYLFGRLDNSFPKFKDVLAQLQQACEKIGGFCMATAADAVSSSAASVSEGCDNAVVACANSGEVALQAVPDALYGISNAVNEVAMACDAPTVHAATTGVNVAEMNISYEKLAEFYNTYGDSIKKVGMNLYHIGATKVGAVESGGGASTVASVATSGTGMLGASYSKLAVAFANCKGALLFAGAGIFGFFRALLYVLVTAIFFVFFLMTNNCRGGKIVEYVPALKEKTKKYVAKQIDVLIEIMVSFFQRQVAICLIEGCYYCLGFWLVGLPYGFLIGFVLGTLNLIPLFGSIVCMPFALTVAYFGIGGSGLRIVLVVIVWVLGLVLDGYFITPKIQGNKTGLGYAGVIFSFLFWSMILGPMLGMLLAIPLSACCVVIWRSVCELTKTARML